MADIFDKVTRSLTMSKVKSKNTKPEMIVRRYFHRSGLRYKLHDKSLPGKPDLVFPKYGTVVFINGCFWHGHKECKKGRLPEDNRLWWSNKITGNMERDRKNKEQLKHLGWKVFIIWECELKKKDAYTFLEKKVNEIKKIINE